MADKKATLKVDGIEETLELPVYEGTVGPDVVDVRSLTGKGLFTYDPGFVSTAATESKITYIDGGAGVLLHRGSDSPGKILCLQQDPSQEHQTGRWQFELHKLLQLDRY